MTDILGALVVLVAATVVLFVVFALYDEFKRRWR